MKVVLIEDILVLIIVIEGFYKLEKFWIKLFKNILYIFVGIINMWVLVDLRWRFRIFVYVKGSLVIIRDLKFK